MRDQRVFEFQDLLLQAVDARLGGIPHRLCFGKVDLCGLRLNQHGQIMALRRIGLQPAPAANRGLEVHEPAIKPRLRQRRRQVADQRRSPAPLGNRALRRVVGGIEVKVRHVSDQPVRPAGLRQAGLLAGHEFQRAMRAEMQHRMRAEILAQVAVEGGEGVGRREALLEQQPHRVAFIAEGGLDADEDIVETLAQNVDARTIRLLASGSRAPLGLDLVQVLLTTHMVIGGNAVDHIGIAAEALGISFQDARLKLIDGGGHLHLVAIGLHCLQRVEQRLEHREESGGAHRTRIGREVEQHDGDLALRLLRLAQRHQLRHTARQHGGALGMHAHAALAIIEPAAPAEHHAARSAVEFGDGDHHGGLDRVQPALGAFPFFQRLEFHGLCGEIGHVQPRQHLFGTLGVIVGRPADEREAAERDQRINRRLATLHEEALDGGALVEACGEGGDHLEAPRFEGRDHAIIMRRVAREHVGAHQQQPHGALAHGGRGWKLVRRLAHTTGKAGVIDAHFRVGLRILEADGLAQALARSLGEFRHEEAHHVADVLFRARQPILHGQEIGPHVLSGAGDEAQDLGQPLQHGQLLFARRRLLGRVVGLGAAQLLQQADDRPLRTTHVEAP